MEVVRDFAAVRLQADDGPFYFARRVDEGRVPASWLGIYAGDGVEGGDVVGLGCVGDCAALGNEGAGLVGTTPQAQVCSGLWAC